MRVHPWSGCGLGVHALLRKLRGWNKENIWTGLDDVNHADVELRDGGMDAYCFQSHHSRFSRIGERLVISKNCPPSFRLSTSAHQIS
jgi:hypothetical protein